MGNTMNNLSFFTQQVRLVLSNIFLYINFSGMSTKFFLNSMHGKRDLNPNFPYKEDQVTLLSYKTNTTLSHFLYLENLRSFEKYYCTIMRPSDIYTWKKNKYLYLEKNLKQNGLC